MRHVRKAFLDGTFMCTRKFSCVCSSPKLCAHAQAHSFEGTLAAGLGMYGICSAMMFWHNRHCGSSLMEQKDNLVLRLKERCLVIQPVNLQQLHRLTETQAHLSHCFACHFLYQNVCCLVT